MRAGLRVAIGVTVATLGLNVLVTWLVVLAHAARPRQRPDAGMVVVCGYRLADGRIPRAYRRRLDALAGLMRAAPALRGLLTGGGRPSEAGAGRAYLIAAHGIEPERLQVEDLSNNTFENLANARDLLGSAGQVHILSSRFHLARLAVFARQLGLGARLVPAEPRFVPGPYNLLATGREAVYLCWFLTGRAWARLTGNRRMLARIR